MSAQLYLAPAAAGKTAFAIDLARQSAHSLGAEVRVCVPTGPQAGAWRRRLAEQGGAIGVHVLTFDRLVAACLGAAGEAYTELSQPIRRRLLRTIIDQMTLDYYAPLKGKSGFVQVAADLILELKSAAIEPEPFLEAISQLGDQPRLRELAFIYAQYQDRLQENKWADRIGLHWLAFEALAERAPNVGQDWPLLIVDGFDDFTAIQLKLIKKLAGRVGRVVLTLTQAANVDYPRYAATRRELEEALDVVGAPLPASARPPTTHPALSHLARQLFFHSPAAPLAGDDALTMREAPTPAAETRTALRWLKQRIVLDSIPPDQVALVARDIATYRHHIRQIAAEFGLPIRFLDGLPLNERPVVAAVLSLLKMHLPGAAGAAILPRRLVVSTWRSPFFDWGEGDLAIAPADAEDLDRLARQQRVIGGLEQWQTAFEARIRVFDGAEYDEPLGPRVPAGDEAQLLKDKFFSFLERTRPPSAASTMRQFVHWLETLLGSDPHLTEKSSPDPGSLNITDRVCANQATAAEDIAALRLLKEILRGLVWAEEAVGGHVSLSFAQFFAELSNAIIAARYNLNPEAHSQILVASVTQLRGLSFQAMAIMGLGEGAFPATVREDPFLRDADRQTLRERFGFPLPSSTRSAEREFFYEAVTRPQKRLLLTRSTLADNGADWVASPFWQASRELVTMDVSYLRGEYLPPIVEAASWAEWWEAISADPRLGAQARNTDRAIWGQILTASHIWQVRSSALTTTASVVADAWEGNLSPLAADLAGTFGPDHVWSANRLEAYQTCGFLFFCQNVLGLAPRPEPAEGLDARQLGSIYHSVFEKVYTAGIPHSGGESAVRDHVARVAAPVLNAAPEKEGFRQTPWWPLTRDEIVDNVVRTVLLLPQEAFSFFQAEVPFGIRGPALTVAHDGDHLKLRGLIDRIDRNDEGQIRLIDYKTRVLSLTKPAFAKSEKLQLPLYALAAQETLGLGQVVDGFYWGYLGAKSSTFTLHGAEGGVEGAIETAVIGVREAVEKIRAGQFTPRPPKGGCPQYCPAANYCWQYEPKNTW